MPSLDVWFEGNYPIDFKIPSKCHHFQYPYSEAPRHGRPTGTFRVRSGKRGEHKTHHTSHTEHLEVNCSANVKNRGHPQTCGTGTLPFADTQVSRTWQADGLTDPQLLEQTAHPGFSAKKNPPRKTKDDNKPAFGRPRKTLPAKKKQKNRCKQTEQNKRCPAPPPQASVCSDVADLAGFAAGPPGHRRRAPRCRWCRRSPASPW